MSRGKKLSLFLVFFIYLSAATAALARPGLRAALDAFGRWRLGEAAFPTGTALAAAGIAAAVLVLAYIFYYIAAESRKYFSLALRAGMWLCVFAALAPALSNRYLEPFLESHEYGLPPGAVRLITDTAPALAVAVAAFIMICGMRGAVKRAAKAAFALAEGTSEVHLRQASGDELQELAAAVNSFAREYSKRTQGVLRRDESYMKFIPQQLVSLMGVDDIEQINRNTALVRVVSVLAVRFGLPDEAFKGDVADLFAQINGIITRGTEFVHKNGGIIYNFYHDGYDAVFAGEVADAVSAAVTMRHDIMAYNRERLAADAAPVTLRAAIDRGEVMMGVVGDESRFAPAAVSVYLNSARSLAKLAGRLDAGLLCTVEVAESAGSYSQRYVGKSLKTANRRVYEIFDGDSLEMRTAKEKSREKFAEGVYLLYARDFTGAKRIFMDIVRGNASDGVSRFYLFLADRLEKSGGGDAEEEEALYLT